MLKGNSLNFFSFIWLDESRIEPFLATSDSQVVRKKVELVFFTKLRLKPSNFSESISLKQKTSCSYQSFSKRMLSKASFISSQFSQYKNLPPLFLKLKVNFSSTGSFCSG